MHGDAVAYRDANWGRTRNDTYTAYWYPGRIVPSIESKPTGWPVWVRKSVPEMSKGLNSELFSMVREPGM